VSDQPVVKPPRPPWGTGHYYNPVPGAEAIAEVVRRKEALWAARKIGLPGIQLDLVEMGDHFHKLMNREYPAWLETKPRVHLLYQGKNGWFDRLDAMALGHMMMQFRPKQIIEVGSGWSTAAMLDVCNFAKLDIGITCIDPNAERLKTRVPPEHRPSSRMHIIEARVQDMMPDLFERLGAGDILFIDSSHVMKLGSDVNYLFFEILPRLAPGVLVHVHDILFPFEYPESWIAKNYAWNEAYALRALLTGSEQFKICCWVDATQKVQPSAWEMHRLKLNIWNAEPAHSLWMRRL